MSKLPTICFLTGTLNAFAGAERMTAVIANALAERGYRVFVLSLWDPTSVFPLHPDVVHDALFESRPSFKRQYLATVAGIRRFVRQHGIDVLIEVDTMLTLFTLPATVGLTVRRIAWEHCHFDEDLGKPARRIARRLAARRADGIIVLTKRDCLRWLDALTPHCKVSTIPNPLPFHFPKEIAAGNSKTVLAVGRLVRAKGFDVLIRAWSHISTTHPQWRLHILGDGDERQNLETIVREQHISHSVRFLENHRNVEDAYAVASIFCLSSRYEGFGLVLLEAMAFGLPVVSTDCEAGPRELLRDRINALVAPVDDPYVLSRRLTELMDDHELARTLGRQARKDAWHYRIDVIVDQWEALLKQHFPPPSSL